MSVSGEDAGGGGRFVSMAQPQNICCRNHRARKPLKRDLAGNAAEREGAAVPVPWEGSIAQSKETMAYPDQVPGRSGAFRAASGCFWAAHRDGARQVRGASAGASTDARGAERKGAGGVAATHDAETPSVTLPGAEESLSTFIVVDA